MAKPLLLCAVLRLPVFIQLSRPAASSSGAVEAYGAEATVQSSRGGADAPTLRYTGVRPIVGSVEEAFVRLRLGPICLRFGLRAHRDPGTGLL